jgi:hypothetical protein
MEDRAKVEQEICGLRELFLEKFDQNNRMHEAILTQTTRTNGRVRSLEVWRGIITGAVSIITIFFLPLAFVIIKSWLNLK